MLSPAAAARIKGRFSLFRFGFGAEAAGRRCKSLQCNSILASMGTLCPIPWSALCAFFLLLFLILPSCTLHLKASERSEGYPLHVKAAELGQGFVTALDEVSGELFYVAKAVLSITVCHRFISEDGSVSCEWWHFRYDVGIEVLRQLVPDKKAYIGQLESLAGAAFNYTYDPSRLRGRQIYHWIDNLAAVAGLSKRLFWEG